MKTIKFFLIQILVISLCSLAFAGMQRTEHSMLLQSSDENISLINLNKSAEIISKRVDHLGAGEFDISVIPEKKQIRIEYTDNLDSQILENLVVSNGKMN
jgi:hypothetical protein